MIKCPNCGRLNRKESKFCWKCGNELKSDATKVGKNVFDILTISYITFIILLMLYNWEKYPIFIDIYYHLSVMVGFLQSGGIVLHDFWEFAPAGRPHLYPPFLHILELMLFKIGLSEAFIGKLVSFGIFPLQMVTMAIFMRKVYSSKSAFFSVLFLAYSSQYLWANSVISASALVIALLPLVFLSVEREKLKSSTIFLTLSLYTHLGIPHTTALALLIYGVLNREKLKFCLKTVFLSYFLYLPWGIHAFINRNAIHRNFDSSWIDPSTLIHLVLVFFGILGGGFVVYKALKGRKKYLLPLCYLLALTPVMFTAPNRYWLSNGGMPFAMLAGIFLSFLYEKISNMKFPKAVPALFVITIFVILLTFDPVLTMERQPRQAPPQFIPQKPLEFQKSLKILNMKSLPLTLALKNLALKDGRGFRDNWLNEENLMLAKVVEENTSVDDIVFAQGPLGCFITSFTGRAQSNGMWVEILPDERISPMAAKIVIVEKKDKRIPEGLEKIAEFSMYVVYKQKSMTAKRIVVPAAIPYYVAFGLVFFAFSLIFFDYKNVEINVYVLGGIAVLTVLMLSFATVSQSLEYYSEKSFDRERFVKEKNLPPMMGKVEEFQMLLQKRIDEGFDVSEALELAKKSKEAAERGDMLEAERLLDKAIEILKNPKEMIKKQSFEAIGAHMQKAAIYLENVLKGGGESISIVADEIEAISTEDVPEPAKRDALFVSNWLRSHQNISDEVLLKILDFLKRGDLKGLAEFLRGIP